MEFRSAKIDVSLLNYRDGVVRVQTAVTCPGWNGATKNEALSSRSLAPLVVAGLSSNLVRSAVDVTSREFGDTSELVEPIPNARLIYFADRGSSRNVRKGWHVMACWSRDDLRIGDAWFVMSNVSEKVAKGEADRLNREIR